MWRFSSIPWRRPTARMSRYLSICRASRSELLNCETPKSGRLAPPTGKMATQWASTERLSTTSSGNVINARLTDRQSSPSATPTCCRQPRRLSVSLINTSIATSYRTPAVVGTTRNAAANSHRPTRLPGGDISEPKCFLSARIHSMEVSRGNGNVHSRTSHTMMMMMMMQVMPAAHTVTLTFDLSISGPIHAEVVPYIEYM